MRFFNPSSPGLARRILSRGNPFSLWDLLSGTVKMTNRRDPVHRLYPYSSVAENYNRSFPSVKGEIEIIFHCSVNSDSHFSQAFFPGRRGETAVASA
ncbi:hypothetical protein RAH42_12110 [Pyramidobacter sp. YE332]|uniref:hypothetical protein n=1 Tax=unclassified Pyramidobacter TaxID=2632171 RepID=UPI00098FDEA0|nr:MULTISPECIES: hypothetical protein [unclassified Pyramidobacter]OON90029.1 hypothetical protein B0D78_00055 [Pyramidobacter sp. C12-8]WOL39863.1 hypothetical protein RAH42_12110 [Pyramidobacter sp. YE332]